jgi:hypothetical protein
MGVQRAGAAKKGIALVSVLTTAATVATQVARMVKATETTAGVARRARDRMMKNQQIVPGMVLGALGLGFILGFAIGRGRKRARMSKLAPEASETGTIADAPWTEPVTDVPQTDSSGSAEATEVS